MCRSWTDVQHRRSEIQERGQNRRAIVKRTIPLWQVDDVLKLADELLCQAGINQPATGRGAAGKLRQEGLMGFGWLKTVGKLALEGVKLAGPALPWRRLHRQAASVRHQGRDRAAQRPCRREVPAVADTGPVRQRRARDSRRRQRGCCLDSWSGCTFKTLTSGPGSTSASRRRWRCSLGGCREQAGLD